MYSDLFTENMDFIGHRASQALNRKGARVNRRECMYSGTETLGLILFSHITSNILLAQAMISWGSDARCWSAGSAYLVSILSGYARSVLALTCHAANQTLNFHGKYDIFPVRAVR